LTLEHIESTFPRDSERKKLKKAGQLSLKDRLENCWLNKHSISNGAAELQDYFDATKTFIRAEALGSIILDDRADDLLKNGIFTRTSLEKYLTETLGKESDKEREKRLSGFRELEDLLFFVKENNRPLQDWAGKNDYALIMVGLQSGSIRLT
jgi:hypothetical protein